jgi:hypothetical protein
LQPDYGATGVEDVLLIFVIIALSMDLAVVGALSACVAVQDQFIVHIALCGLDYRFMQLSALGFSAG